MDYEEVIAKFHNRITIEVKKFLSTQYKNGFRNGNLKYDENDLYQECVLRLLEVYRKSGKPLEEFQVSKFEFKNAMCRYIAGFEACTFTGRAGRNLQQVQEMSKLTFSCSDTVEQDRGIGNTHKGNLMCSTMDTAGIEQRISFDAFMETLPETDRQAVMIVLDGGTWNDVKKKLCKNSANGMNIMKNRIKKQYDQFMGEHHEGNRDHHDSRSV